MIKSRVLAVFGVKILFGNVCDVCVVSVSCGQELEELLLEASLETGREAP